MTRQKDMKQMWDVLEGMSKDLPKQTLAEVLHVFLTSRSNEILQTTMPIGSMSAIYGNIYHQQKPQFC